MFLFNSVKTLGLFFLSIIIISILLITGCNAQSAGIFYVLSKEEAISKANSGLGKEGATYTDLIRYNDLYVLRGSILYVTAVPDTANFPTTLSFETWQAVNLGGRFSVVSIASHNTDLYATFIGNAEDLPGASGQVLKKTSFSALGQATNVSWSDVALTGVTSGHIADLLFTANNQLFLQTKRSASPLNGYIYHLYYLNGGTWSRVTLLGEGYDHDSFLNIAYDGTNYWIAKSFGIFKNTDLGTDFGVETLPTSAPWPAYTNLTVSGANVFVTSQKNTIYYFNGTIWDSVSSADTKFTDIEVFSMQDKKIVDGLGTEEIILAGTKDHGLFRLSITPSLTLSKILRGAGNYGSTKFYPSNNASNNPDIFLSNPGGNNSTRLPAFALVPGFGLWASYLNTNGAEDSPSLVWTWE